MMNMEGNLCKHFLIGFFLLLCSSSSWSQSGDRGVLITEVGAGVSGYRLLTNYTFTESIGVDYGIVGHFGYNFHKRVGLSLELEARKYFPSDSVEVDRINANRMGLGAAYHMVNTHNFLLSISMHVGGFGFNYNVLDSINTIDIKAAGIYQKIGMTARYFFGKSKRIGIFGSFGFVNNPMTYQSFEYNSENQELIDGDLVTNYKVLSSGYYANIGLTFNWRIKKYINTF